MSRKQKLLVVTDLDGSFLNDDYTWSQAKPALVKLKALGSPLVLNSSKTFSEMKDLADELGFCAPIVAENGGLLAIPEASGVTYSGKAAHRAAGYIIEIKGLARVGILSKAHELRERYQFEFAGFSDWSVSEVVERTGLSLSAAQKSQLRYTTEPIIWTDSQERLSIFEASLASHQIRILSGGRFMHLMGLADKADGTAAVLKRYQQAEPETDWTVVALGDSANDLAMLEVADIAVVIPHEDGPRLKPRAPRVVHAPFPATKGWNDALLSIIDEFC